MTTRFVGLKEFRANITRIALDAKKKNQIIVVLRKNEPICEINPLLTWDDEGIYKEEFVKSVLKAQRQAKRGKVYTPAQVRKALGL